MTQLQNKVAIITGAASGIGKEIARRFAKEAAKVVIADLMLAAARATATDISAGHIALAAEMDVSDEAAVEAGVATAMTVFGKVDMLVSNAGIQIVHPLEEFPFARCTNIAVELGGSIAEHIAVMHSSSGAQHLVVWTDVDASSFVPAKVAT